MKRNMHKDLGNFMKQFENVCHLFPEVSLELVAEAKLSRKSSSRNNKLCSPDKQFCFNLESG